MVSCVTFIQSLHLHTIPNAEISVAVSVLLFYLNKDSSLISFSDVLRTVVHNVLVGSVSFASPSKALHNASTAQEITVITESASNFQFKVRKLLSFIQYHHHPDLY